MTLAASCKIHNYNPRQSPSLILPWSPSKYRHQGMDGGSTSLTDLVIVPKSCTLPVGGCNDAMTDFRPVSGPSSKVPSSNSRARRALLMHTAQGNRSRVGLSNQSGEGAPGGPRSNGHANETLNKPRRQGTDALRRTGQTYE